MFSGEKMQIIKKNILHNNFKMTIKFKHIFYCSKKILISASKKQTLANFVKIEKQFNCKNLKTFCDLLYYEKIHSSFLTNYN